MVHRVIPRAITGSARPLAIADRYERKQLVGRGGMAVVYEAVDKMSGARVALKQLQPLSDPAKQQRNLELFEREFHTLVQLVHPRIVRVYEFGVDPEGAYYVMELLEGGDLQERAPLPWRSACAIARDVCSALSLLHSRRFVHRDLSPRNVRCLIEGPAKLIDFGAMARVGPTKLLVGTPPCCAPESVALQSVDGRTDLFGLGATLYFMLTGKHAFPARSFAALPEHWRAGFPRPSELVPDIPPELDALLLDLLRTDPDARPASAAEVMERLSAIDGQNAAEELRVANAYLATPVLVGRDAQLARVRKRFQRTTSGRSRSMVIESDSGMGRTRFLDACSLDATLTGQVVVRADSDDSDSGDYGVVRAIARQLLDKFPQLARETAAPVADRLATLLPSLAPDQPPQPANTQTRVERVHVQRALHQWLTELSKRRPLVLVVDDFDRIDEPSASFIALLEQDTDHELCLLISVDLRRAWTAEAARKILQALPTLRLEPLATDDCEKLLQSVFGVVPHVELLARRLHEVSSGSPRDLLLLAQRMVDRGSVRYAGGSWTLPATIEAADIPASIADALQAQVTSLPEDARRLAAALSLCPEESFTLEELGQLCDIADPTLRLAAVETLIAADIAKRIRDHDIKLSQASWVPAIRATLSVEQERALERRMAECFERRDAEEFRAAQHWFRADEIDRALDVLVSHSERSQEITARSPELFMNYILGLPGGWFETFQEAARQCQLRQRPPLHRYLLLSRLLGIMGLLNAYDATLLADVFVYLQRCSGYDDWYELDPSMDPKLRLQTALARAQARHQALPERERVLDVGTAIRHLSRAVVAAVGGISFALDVHSLRELPQIAIFAALSPALEVSAKLVEGVDARYSGRLPRARRVYAELLARVSQPDRASLDGSHAGYVRLGVSNALGLIEASLGMRSCLEWADKIATLPAYEVNATLIHMIFHLYQGDLASAEQCKRSADRLRIQNSARQLYEGGHLIAALNAYALSGDLTRVRHVREEIAPFARRFEPWAPVLRYANAEYYRLTRDYERAKVELERVLREVRAGVHQIWQYAAAAHVMVLIDCNECGRALECASDDCAAAESDLEYLPDQLQLAAALAAAAMQRPDAAAVVDAQIARLNEAGIAGLYLGVAHETRARIALQMHDMPAFGRHTELCGQYFLVHKNAALTAKYHRLLQAGRRTIDVSVERAAGTPDSAANYGGTRIELALAGCHDGDQRARLALTLLTRHSGASAGVLFLLSDDGPVCTAAVGEVSDPLSFLPRVDAYLQLYLEGEQVTATKSDSEKVEDHSFRDTAGRLWTPMLISHQSGGQLAITGVVVFGVATDAAFAPRAETAAAISRFYSERGASSILAKD